MISWDPEVVQSIGRRRSVIMIGSGVSRNSVNRDGKRPPTWEGFLREASKSLGSPPQIEKLIDQRDYLTACEIVKRKMARDGFISLVQREYQQAGYQSALIHEHIYNLDSAIIASPNFDNIYDTYAAGASNGTLVMKDHTSSDIVNYLGGGEVRLLLKTHGSANNPAQLIFTRRDYAAARTKHVLFYEILKSLVLTHTFLFLGCGIDDPDIRALFEDVQFAHERMPHHFMTMPQGEVDDDVMAIATEAMKVKFLQYSPANGHEELTGSLGELVKLVDAFRDLRAGDRKW
ncbi:SIR2 family protein [Variovorax ureilyticus]|uniref:SIR2 family protein n=1 Tax=Variovorax ureilyticus TaxID=1836198 RepID=A0ABU8VFM9_9BURK